MTTWSVGVGWHDILNELVNAIGEDKIKILQVKEKFGGLRFYFSFLDSVDNKEKVRIIELVRQAEYVAERTCERCGKLGSLRKGSWLKTLCDSCQKD